MENHENIEKIKELKKKFREELEQLRSHQTIVLEQFCIDHGGHYFWDWRQEEHIPGSRWIGSLREFRPCYCCGYKEWRNIK